MAKSLRQKWHRPPIPGGPFLELCAANARRTYDRERAAEKTRRHAERYGMGPTRLREVLGRKARDLRGVDLADVERRLLSLEV